MEEIRVVAFAGSLRKRSFNRALLRAVMARAPGHFRIEHWDRLAGLPAYDQDLYDAGPPAIVADLNAAIEAAHALLFVTAEYNYGIPGFLKNAIDWASRPGGRSVMRGMPAGIMGASTGPFGAVRGQIQLRTILQAIDILVMPQPQVLVMHAKDRFNEALELTDERTVDVVDRYLDAFGTFINRVAG